MKLNLSLILGTAFLISSTVSIKHVLTHYRLLSHCVRPEISQMPSEVSLLDRWEWVHLLPMQPPLLMIATNRLIKLPLNSMNSLIHSQTSKWVTIWDQSTWPLLWWSRCLIKWLHARTALSSSNWMLVLQTSQVSSTSSSLLVSPLLKEVTMISTTQWCNWPNSKTWHAQIWDSTLENSLLICWKPSPPQKSSTTLSPQLNETSQPPLFYDLKPSLFNS